LRNRRRRTSRRHTWQRRRIPRPARKTGAHAALYRFTDPARQRYTALLTTDPAAAQAFRAALRSYSRAYALLAAIMPWHYPDLERLYLFGKFLLLLDRREDPGVDIGKVDLTHLRVVRKGVEDASLAADAGRSGTARRRGSARRREGQQPENYGYVFDPRLRGAHCWTGTRPTGS
jgi:hypothetical protein